MAGISILRREQGAFLGPARDPALHARPSAVGRCPTRDRFDLQNRDPSVRSVAEAPSRCVRMTINLVSLYGRASSTAPPKASDTEKQRALLGAENPTLGKDSQGWGTRKIPTRAKPARVGHPHHLRHCRTALRVVAQSAEARLLKALFSAGAPHQQTTSGFAGGPLKPDASTGYTSIQLLRRAPRGISGPCQA